MHPFEVCQSQDSGETFALLYSGMQSQGSGEQSLLAWQPKRELKGGGFDELASAPPATWFGYAGYEMLHRLEDVPCYTPPPIALPAQWWFEPTQMLTFQQKDSVQAAKAASQNDQTSHPVSGDSRCTGSVEVKELQSNFTTQRYVQIVQDTIAQIHAGAFYQANITRKFFGRFDRAPNSFALFQRLCAISPSPYSAYMQFGDTAILSSSPEGFLQLSPSGRLLTRPMKGTAAAADTALGSSHKDRAENLMIVDLMRNDLARCCTDVRVESLYDVHDFATVRQMISTISGQRRANASAIDCLTSCFPAGSMTGAPKVAAMQWIARQEQMQRGVYSGTLGWIDTANQTADLSVVIRTLIVQGDRFEFQVGGGIVADSDPHKELDETLLKARAICALLGIDTNALRSL